MKKYEEIVNHIINLIEEGNLKSGDKLPSIRKLSQEFNVNKATVIKGYEELERAHKINSIPRSGYYVIHTMDTHRKKQELIDFTKVLPDPKLLPYKEFNHCVTKAVEIYKDNLFLYSHAQGLESLRKVLEKTLRSSGVFGKKEELIITNGAQQALNILCSMEFHEGRKKILVEQPTYGLMYEIAELNNIPLVGISRNSDGIDFKAFEKILKEEEIKLFYTMPRFHNPTGTSYTEKEKKRILELCERYGVYIIEDDYLGDLTVNEQSLPIHYYDTTGRVIYIKSFSKTFMPGIRVGCVVIKKDLKERFLRSKYTYDLNTSALTQGALEIYLKSGMYEKHVKRVREKYKEKMNLAREIICGQELSDVEINIPYTGIFIWIKIKFSLRMDYLIKVLRKKGVIIKDGNLLFIEEDRKESHIRLCISNLSNEEIEIGLTKLIEEINYLRR